jgi:flagellar biosynthetic protein FlhB
MSEDADKSSKTEEPTTKKLEDSRERGSVAVSREVNTWMLLLAGGIVMLMFSEDMARDLTAMSLKFVESPHAISFDDGNIHAVLSDVLMDFLEILSLPFILFVFAAIASGILQNGISFSPKALEMKFSKFNPIKGFKRIFSGKQIVEFIKGILKMAIVGIVAAVPLLPTFERIDALATYDISYLPGQLRELVIMLFIGVLSVMAVIAIIDLIYQRWEHNRNLRMTKQEVKDEHKQTDGDPTAKQRLRKVRMERAQRRMMQAVPDADVVITNPTHFAVAMKYDPETMSAPLLVAKGQDLVAFKIREIAEENDITIVENKPLAQALYFGVDIDDEVPEDHYKAVAEIISYVWNVKGRTMPTPAGEPAAAAE